MQRSDPQFPPASGFKVANSRFLSFISISSSNLYLSLVTLLFLAAIGWFGFTSVEKEIKDNLSQNLRVILSANEKSLRFWIKDMIRYTEVLASQPEMRKNIISLIRIAKNEDVTAETLIKTQELIWLREYLGKVTNRYEFTGFVIFDPTGYQVGALLDEPVGKRQLIERSDFFYRSLQGDTVVSQPFPGEVDLPDNEGIMRPDQPTMFVSTPVRDDSGNIMGVLAFRIPPGLEFTHMLSMSRFGKTGESYAFNNAGLLLTESRFFDELKQKGLISRESEITSILNIQLRDPNNNATLTRMVASAVKGESGVDVDGYHDYRGVQVVGAWAWLPDLKIGIATEIDAEEAFGTLRTISYGFLAIFGLLTAATCTAFLFRLIQIRMEKERNQAQERAMEREIRIRALIDYALDGIITLNREGFIETLNPAGEALFGYHSSEILNKNISLLLPEPHRGNFNQYLQKFLSPQKGSGLEMPGEMQGLRKNGSVFNLEISVSSMVFKGRTKFIGILRDITARKKAEEKLRAHAKFQTAVTQLGLVALAGIDLANLMAHTVGLLRETLGVEFSKILKCIPEENTLLLIAGAGWQEGLAGKAKVPAGRDSQAGYTLLSDKPVVVADLNKETRFSGPPLLRDHGVTSGVSVVIRAGARPFGVLGVHTKQAREFSAEEIHFVLSIANVLADAIERKKAEEKLQIYARELERSNQELEDFAFIASHDLQEPLRKVILFGDRIKTTYPPEGDNRGKDYIDRLQKSMSTMQNFIQDLLQYSRITRSSSPFKPVNLDQTLTQVIANLQMQIDETQAQIKVASLPTISGDERQMTQLFQNLISNALKYSRENIPPGIQIRCCPNGEAAWDIRIEDNGIGIDPKYFAKIFKPFERLHTGNQYSGTGIGLSICAKVASHHKGEIRVESEPGKGSTFIITLPRLKPDPRPACTKTKNKRQPQPDSTGTFSASGPRFYDNTL